MLLGANYLQHARTPGATVSTQSRNFLGGVNAAWFNIGYHTAHHASPRLHWSLLPARHRALASAIPPELVEPSLPGYVWRQLVMAPLTRRYAPTGEALTGRR
jgi:fatty acid desaturase